ncbi:hypothetical protein OAB20_06350 [Winogradskyella sp.]|nr:hypothetical protein [Winogradskyella sp.]
MKLFYLVFLFTSIASFAQKRYDIPLNTSEGEKIRLLKVSFADCGKFELNNNYNLLKNGLISPSSYKLKSESIASNHASSRQILSMLNVDEFDLNKLPSDIQIYYDGSDYEFKFIIKGKRISTYELYLFLQSQN